MEEALKCRRSARGWLTRAVKRTNSLLSEESPDPNTIQSELKELNLRLDNLNVAQEKVEILLDEKDLDKDIEEADKFLDPMREVKVMAERYISDISHGRSPAEENTLRQNGVSAQPTANLPKIEIKKFTGQYEDWQEFWDKFSAIIDSSNMATISKFSYLQSLLEGEALTTIKGLSLTENNYNVATSLLKDRYGRKERIIFSHIQRLINLEIPNSKEANKLWKAYNELISNIRSLRHQGITGEQYGVILTPMIVSRLPNFLRFEWARVSDHKESDLSFLMEFLQEELKRRDRSQNFSMSSHAPLIERKRPTPSASALLTKEHVENPRNSSLCCFCNKRHASYKCWNLKKMQTDQVREILREKHLCFRCFRSDHRAKDCTMRCELCSGNHNKLFCSKHKTETLGQSNIHRIESDSSSIEDNGNNRNDKIYYHHSKFTNRTTVMQTISVVINDTPCTVLFDSGSDKSFITSSCVKRVKPKYIGHEQVSHTCFGERRPRHPSRRNVFEIDYTMTDGNKKSFVVTEIPTITAPMYREKIPESFLKDIEDAGLTSLKDVYKENENIIVDILIGLDAYWNLMTQKVISTSHGLVAQQSIFGWLLCGSYPLRSQENLKPVVHKQNLCLTDLSDSLVRSFWELEHMGIKAIEKSPDQTLALFNKKIHFVGDRFEVDLPWKENRKMLLENNYEQAKQRLYKLEKRLDTNPNLKDRYHMVLNDLENEGIFEEVPIEEIDTKEHPVFYLPHRPVIKESSETTKIRPVFDASAAGPNGVTLNSCMHTGPNMTNNLLEILLRFRRWRFAMSGDITKAFLQIQVGKIDRDVHRFLMKKDSSLRVMRIARVPFGNTCSPFLLNATVRYYLSCQPPSRVVEELSTNLYVDDWLTGADSSEELLSMKDEAQSIMEKISMPLTKWGSNCSEVADQKIQVIKEKGDEVYEHKVLGILWMPEEDCFSFVGFDLSSPSLVITRRVVLSCISRIFDPIGFLQPFVMVGKVVFQSLWKKGIQWDDRVPEEEEKTFIKWMNQVKRINEFQIPRCYVKCSWENKRELEIHAFSDASEKAYGSCVYMKVKEEDGSVTVSLVIAKAKLAPVKKVTLPRLELLGALLSSRLLAYVKKALLLPESTPYRCWTDSTVALQWIQNDPNKWKTFVANRVTEIQGLTSPEFWGHCDGRHNPADILSRGVMLEGLLTSSLWFRGPPWLSEDSRSFLENTPVDNSVEGVEIEEQKDCCVQLNVDSTAEPFLPTERWGEFSKAIRIVAWILRFVSFCRGHKENRKVSRDLTVEEIDKGKIMLLRSVQGQYFANEVQLLQNNKEIPVSSKLYKLKPFLGHDGLLRLEGRIQFSGLSFGSKHPIILPRCHVTELISRREHLHLKHAGVPQMISSIRDQYWIIGIRKLARKVKNMCPKCVRVDSLPCQQPMAPLPKERTQRSEPFSVTGVDFAGPIFSADYPGVKHYICLFTCGVIRAVHLELVDDLSLTQFLLAFKRFVSRRRMPTTIFSDQAKTFKAAAKKLIEVYSDRSPVWKFITPRCPWAGGMWERCVRTVKSSLRKCLGTRSLTKSELLTILCEIEQCVNSRPLTFVGDTIDSSEILTPNHFLNGGRVGYHTSIVLKPDEPTVTGIQHMARVRNQDLEKFWSVWTNDYIRQLPHAPVAKSRGRIKVGSVVLIKDDNTPKLKWPLGLITNVFPGRDNLIRTVEVRTQRGLIVRPIQRIYNLEVSDCEPLVGGESNLSNTQGDTDDVSVSQQNLDDVFDKDNNMVRTRVGRVVKPRKVLDL